MYALQSILNHEYFLLVSEESCPEIIKRHIRSVVYDLSFKKTLRFGIIECAAQGNDPFYFIQVETKISPSVMYSHLQTWRVVRPDWFTGENAIIVTPLDDGYDELLAEYPNE